MLEIKNLSIEVGNRSIIDNLSLVLNKNDKLVIIGEEGNGKSTLLKCIAGICDYAPRSGVINYKDNTIGYLAQNLLPEILEEKVFNFLFKNDEDYYNKINQFYKFLGDLEINETIIHNPLKKLSGGEKIKIQILKMLLADTANMILHLELVRKKILSIP